MTSESRRRQFSSERGGGFSSPSSLRSSSSNVRSPASFLASATRASAPPSASASPFSAAFSAPRSTNNRASGTTTNRNWASAASALSSVSSPFFSTKSTRGSRNSNKVNNFLSSRRRSPLLAASLSRAPGNRPSPFSPMPLTPQRLSLTPAAARSSSPLKNVPSSSSMSNSAFERAMFGNNTDANKNANNNRNSLASPAINTNSNTATFQNLVNLLENNANNTSNNKNRNGKSEVRVKGLFGDVIVTTAKNNQNNLNARNAPRLNIKQEVPCLQAATTRSGLGSAKFQHCLRTSLKPRLDQMFAASNRASQAKTVPEMDAMCNPRQRSLAPHQIVAHELAKTLASSPSPEAVGEYRGMLIWSNTGAGKTVSAVSILAAYLPSDKRIYVVTTASNREQNNPDKYIRELLTYFPHYATALIQAHRKAFPRESSLPDARILQNAFKKRVQFLSFLQATNALEGDFKKWKNTPPLWDNGGSVLLIDEAHGLAQGPSRTDKKGLGQRFGVALRRLSKPHMRLVHVYALTATPGNTVQEWLSLLSTVRRANDIDFSASRYVEWMQNALEGLLHTKSGANTSAKARGIKKFVQKHLLGLVSYVDFRSDRARHACVRESNQLVPMQPWYYLSFLNACSALRIPGKGGANVTAHFKFDPKQPQKFFDKMRVYGNYLLGSAYGWIPGTIRDREQKSRLDNRWLSCKLLKLVKVLATAPGKHYVYTVGAESVIASALEQLYGFDNATDEVVMSRGGKLGPNSTATSGKRFLVVRDVGSTANRDALEAIQQTFDSPQNLNGSHIKIVIASGRFYEGLDLKALRYVHIAEPMHTSLAEMQAIGRGVRNCAHVGLPLNQRTVTVVRWFSVAPIDRSTKRVVEWSRLENMMKISFPKQSRSIQQRTKSMFYEHQALKKEGFTSVDEYVFHRARNDSQYLSLVNFENMVKAASVDCSLLNKLHPSIKCRMPKITRKVSVSAGAYCKR